MGTFNGVHGVGRTVWSWGPGEKWPKMDESCKRGLVGAAACDA